MNAQIIKEISPGEVIARFEEDPESLWRVKAKQRHGMEPLLYMERMSDAGA